ncbi:hypothetical protein [Okeania sp. SIO3B5]|nr:hypothetical protein [Okeania sp. SIO3B5]
MANKSFLDINIFKHFLGHAAQTAISSQLASSGGTTLTAISNK